VERSAALSGQRADRLPETLELLSRSGVSLGSWLLANDAQGINLTQPLHWNDACAASVFEEHVANGGVEVRATVSNACEVGSPESRVAFLDQIVDVRGV
jgi:hypothetical protein